MPPIEVEGHTDFLSSDAVREPPIELEELVDLVLSVVSSPLD